jgi:hypothetical protein
MNARSTSHPGTPAPSDAIRLLVVGIVELVVIVGVVVLILGLGAEGHVPASPAPAPAPMTVPADRTT